MRAARERSLPTLAALALAQAVASSLLASEPTPQQIEFFEKRIRPVLVTNCYACHSGAIKAPMGGLRVDTRESLLRGGGRGPAIKPGDPDGSHLLKQPLAHEAGGEEFHSGGRQFATKDDPSWKAIADWVRAAK